MSSRRISLKSTYRNLDPLFFIDYSLFTGVLRQYTASSLEEAFKNSPNEDHRRLFIIGIYREEYSAYEDMGVIIDSFLKWKSQSFDYPIERLMNYKPDSVRLNKIFKKSKINTHTELYSALDLDTWVPKDWHTVFPEINCRKALLGICKFIFVDCARNQNEYGIDAYNQIKHGLKLVPNGSLYINDAENTPAILIKNNQPNTDKYHLLLGIPMTDDDIEKRLRLIDFIQASVRFLTMLYSISRYSDVLKNQRKIENSLQIFETKYMSGILSFVEQIGEK